MVMSIYGNTYCHIANTIGHTAWKRADPQLYRENPYLWWKAREKEYPRLSCMASDVLSIPAMSAQTEREFSSCGRMVGVLRTRLDRWAIAMSQCVRSWKKEGII